MSSFVMSSSCLCVHMNENNQIVILGSLASTTVSQVKRPWLFVLTCATGTSCEASGERDGQSSAHGGDGVGDVTLGSDRRRRGVDDPWEGQAFGAPRRWQILRGE